MKASTRAFDYAAERAYYNEPPSLLRDYQWLEGHFLAFGPEYRRFFHGKRVLDCGAGECLHGRFVTARCSPALYVNVDLFPDRMRLASRQCSGKPLAYVAGDSFALPFRNSTFDIVFVNGVLFRFHPLSAVVSEIARVLVPSGVFLGLEPNFVSPVMEVRRAMMRRRNRNDSRLLPGNIRAAFAEQGFSCKTAFYWRRFPTLRAQTLAALVSPTISIVARREMPRT